MSKLQIHLHALPPGSIVTKEMHRSNIEMNRLLDAARNVEVLQAKQLHEETGCTWQEAVRSVIERTKLNFLVNVQELY